MADYLLLETGDRLLLESGDGLLLESSGGSEIAGTLSVTLGALTSTAAGTVLVSGTESTTLGSLGISAACGVLVQGTESTTLGDCGCSATGTVSTPVSGGGGSDSPRRIYRVVPLPKKQPAPELPPPKERKPEPKRQRKARTLKFVDVLTLPAFEIESTYETFHEPKSMVIESSFYLPGFIMASSAEAEINENPDPIQTLLHLPEDDRRALSAAFRILNSG